MLSRSGVAESRQIPRGSLERTKQGRSDQQVRSDRRDPLQGYGSNREANMLLFFGRKLVRWMGFAPTSSASRADAPLTEPHT